MKIAISVAVGPLHKWGYQHICRECLASQAEFADHVYLVQSTEDATGVPGLLAEFDNIVFISGPSTWHHRPGETDEILRVGELGFLGFTEFHRRNMAIGRQAALRDGYEVILTMHNNWYIPRRNVAALRKYCEEFQQGGQRTGHAWMVAQLHDKVLGPAAHNEGLCNLAGMSEGDVLNYYPDTKWRRTASDAMPADVCDLCVVDCSYNVFPSEFEGMQRRFYYPGHESFDWEERRAKLADRIRRRNVVVDAALDYWGLKIAEKSGPEFMGYQILQEAGLL